MRFTALPCCSALALAIPLPVFADAEVFEATKTDLAAETKFEARFDAVRSQEISIRPAEWKDWIVLSAAAHGARVSKGDVVLEFERQDIEEEIEKLETARSASVAALELAEAELDHQRASTPLELEIAARAARRAQEDLDRFQSEGRPRSEAEARFSLASAEQQLLNQREELEQLQKMYDADDLTEETEEIILKRQKFAVQAAEFSFAGAQLRSHDQLSNQIPRQAADLENARQQTALALELAENTLDRKVLQQELAVQDLKTDRRKAAKHLSDLHKDRQDMTFKAPFDGIVLYGAFRDGRFVSAAEAAKKLLPGGKLAPFEVAMTLVEPAPLALSASVDEAILGRFQTGAQGSARPALLSGVRLPVRVVSAGAVADPDGKYSVRLEVDVSGHPTLKPGMTCHVELEPEERSGVLAVPENLVATENGKSTVRIRLPDGSEETRSVRLGGRGKGMVEILEGLSEGDQVLPKP
ncbi:MAG TPA: hypothetical protein VMN36_18205 [Verrucomicrobiales bacterium]|nr:hypothetical protein [Verrucomicrobiales bacterium]